MFLKLLWILIVAWIAYRVYRAGRNLVRIAFGQGENPLPGPGQDPMRRPGPPPPGPGERSSPREAPPDVEDARWVDL